MNISSDISSFVDGAISKPSSLDDILQSTPIIGDELFWDIYDSDLNNIDLGINATTVDASPPSDSLVSMLSSKTQRPLMTSPVILSHVPLATPPPPSRTSSTATPAPVSPADVDTPSPSPNSTSAKESETNCSTHQPQFKAVHEKKWSKHLAELRLFIKQHGHCLVPHDYKSNPQLARWVKRQRRQYKLLQDGKPSTLSNERVALLKDAGFVWDSHCATWEQRVKELLAYKSQHGNCLVPSTYKNNPHLAIWVKCQRRQWKLWKAGRSSSMTADRAAILERMGFAFEVRCGALPSFSKKKNAKARSPSMMTATESVEPVAVVTTTTSTKQQKQWVDSLHREDLEMLFDTISQL